MEKNVVGWFEIPVTNMDRAIHFYEQVFDLKLTRQQVGAEDMAWFPWSESGSGACGSLVSEPNHYTPSADGVIIYFTAFSGDLAIELERVRSVGGIVLQEKKLIAPEIG